MAAKYLNSTGLSYFFGRLQTLFASKAELNGKVDKVSGKGLSTNDLTDAMVTEIAKIDGLVTQGGEPNVIEGISVNGTMATVTSKTAAITVPTQVSDLTNDSGFVTAAVSNLSNYYSKSEVDGLIPDVSGKADSANVYTKSQTYTKSETDDAITAALESITGVEFVVVDNLPAKGDAGKFYLKANQGAGQNSYDEYVYVNKGTSANPDYAFERLGTMDVDLSGYLQSSDIEAITTAEIDEITATS